MAWLAALQYIPVPAGGAPFFWHHGYQLLPTYAIYVLAGCLAAIHLPTIQSILQRHGRVLVAVGVLAGTGAMVAYVAQLGVRAPRVAAAVLQPAMFLTSLAPLLIGRPRRPLIGHPWAPTDRDDRPIAQGQDTVAMAPSASYEKMASRLIAGLPVRQPGE